MFRGELLKKLEGFDEQFFYHYEENDLCNRVWKEGYPILFFPGAEIIHLGGQSVARFPTRFALETYRGGYRYFFKHYGAGTTKALKKVLLLKLVLRYVGYAFLRIVKPQQALDERLKTYRVLISWNWALDPLAFVKTGVEPDVGYAPMASVSRGAERATAANKSC